MADGGLRSGGVRVADRELGAAFYLPVAEAEPRGWASELLGKLGVRVWIDPYDDQFAEWGGLFCRVRVLDVAPYRILALTYGQNGFAKLLYRNSDDLAQDGALRVAQAFRDACEALRPVVGFVTSQAEEDFEELLTEYADEVRTGNVFGLSQAGFGLVYLREPGEQLDPVVTFHPRDELPVTEGRLIFAGRGADRWWG
jgi:hypothetical protein